MDEKHLMEEVVREVLLRLKGASKECVEPKETLYLIGPAEVEFLYELEKSFHILTSEDRENTGYFSNGEVIEDRIDHVLITRLSIDLMTHIAHGMYLNVDEQVIISAILNGRKITLLSEGILYRQFKQTANKALYLKYMEYEDKLKNFGFQIIRKQDYLWSMQSGIRQQATGSGYDEIDLTAKKLILEKDILDVHPSIGQILHISRHCIITPMAGDLIKERSITVIKE